MVQHPDPSQTAALRQYPVLDALPEEPFDRIARLAISALDAPIALLLLVANERTCLKSCLGLSLEEAERVVALCNPCISDEDGSEDVVVVDDATSDARFSGNALVTNAPGVRFCARAPLVTSEGHIVGSVSVMDTKTRAFSEEETNRLRDLAVLATSEVEHRATRHHRTDVLESITDAFFAVDNEWRFTYVNGQAEHLLGRSRDDLLGKNVWAEFPEATDLAFYEQYHRAIREQESVQFEAFFPPLDTWFNVSAYPFEGGLSVYFDDVTERHALEDDLREREEYLSVTLDSIGDAVITTDAAGCIDEMNTVAETLTGWSREEAGGMHLDDVLRIHSAETGARVESPVAKVLREGGVVGLANHTVLTAKDGTERQIADSAAPIRDESGTLRGIVLVFRDVTETYEKRRALEEERERLQMALMGGELGFWDLNFNTRTNTVNERWAEMLGYTLDEVDNEQAFFEEHTHPDDLARAHAAMERHARREIPHVDVEIRMRHKDGSWRWILDRGKILEWNDDGSPRRAVGTHLDITERKEAAEALATKSERLEMALIGGSIGMWDWDMRTDATVYDERWAAILGYTLREVEFDNTFFERHTHPDDLARVYTDIERHARGEIPYLDQEIRMRHKDGSWRWVLDRGRIVERADDGMPVRMVGTHVDITERKEAEHEIRRQRDLLQNILDTSPAAVVVTDANGQLVRISKQAQDVLGLPLSVVLERRFNDPAWRITDPDGRPIPDEDLPFAQVMERAAPIYGVEHKVQGPEGTQRLLSVNGAPLQGEEGLLGAVFVLEDITERRRRKQELIEAKNAAEAARTMAEEASRLKSALLANMSHEIRTPLTSLIGFSEALDDMDLEPPADQFANMVHSGGKRLLNTLESVLDLAQLEAGAITLTPQSVAIGALVREIVASFQLHAQDVGVDLETRTPETDVIAYIDRGAVERVVSNLVSNAIKFTGEGSASGGCVDVGLDVSEDRLTLTVSDTGVGIAASFVPQLFDAFKQESTGNTRDFEGSGLGLAITKELVDLMGGTITVDSVKGEGATFTVELPRDITGASTGEAAPQP